jgi:hypothetical protein
MKFRKSFRNSIIKGLILLFLCALLIFPDPSLQGASKGLLLWFHNVLPSLLPFIILSNLLIHLNITEQISKVFYPLLGKLFRISSEGCYPIMIGFLSGIPIGAKSTADMVSEHKISLDEGHFLLGISNIVSPVFIFGYIAITQLKLPETKYVLFIIIYGSSILGSVLYRILFLRPKKDTAQNFSLPKPVKSEPSHFSFTLLDASIMNGFEIVTKIGGYIILFSILAQIIKEIGPDTSFIKAILMGILEITTGISQICNTELDIHTKIVLVSILTSFGGISGIAQTKSVLGNTRLSVYAYMIIKLFSAAFAFLFALIYVSFLPI